jgi:hypothetical protein
MESVRQNLTVQLSHQKAKTVPYDQWCGVSWYFFILFI